uniref:NADH-ubiquinone oxidoreductase chain 4L n=1 Tax=Trigonidium sjostedti TaxID=1914573 RepID=A0A1J0M4M9_9ORTH|nr:NADH dehydrogenase subunit 4L [Trigonidium sjostedti]APD14951.1 NADH dehydrogenase subunit 4L [Trigonidium sjostedti]
MMKLLIIYFIFLIYFSGLWMFSSKRKYLLISLLSLEYMMLSVFLMLVFYLTMMMFQMYFLLIFLVFVVCEGALGLSVLVNIVRSFGNNYFQSFSILQC